MSEAESSAAGDDHVAADHHDQHASEELGPIDVQAWAAAGVGAVVAILLVVVMFLVIEG